MVVAIIILQRISIFTSSDRQVNEAGFKRRLNTDSLRIQYSITAQLNGRNDCDVTRLVATEHVRNKYSLQKSFSLFNSHATIRSLIELYCLN